jgi:hypothetical protein
LVDGVKIQINEYSTVQQLYPSFISGTETQVEGVDPLAGSVVRSVKVEYQPRLGPEVCSPSQLAREWVASLVRPSSKLVRLRYYRPSNRRSSSGGWEETNSRRIE